MTLAGIKHGGVSTIFYPVIIRSHHKLTFYLKHTVNHGVNKVSIRDLIFLSFSLKALELTRCYSLFDIRFSQQRALVSPRSLF